MSEKTVQPLFRLRTIAITETLFAIGVLLAINLIYFNGDRFVGINPHPFWFVIILISAQYGVSEGLFAVLVATAAFLIGNVRERGEGEYLYSYLLDINAQPLLWLISALILGSLRFRHVMERDRLQREVAEASQREDIVAIHYEQVRKIRETLEQRLVRHVHTTVDTYKAARLMETYDPGKILEGIQELVVSLLGPRQFSVFMLRGDSLEASLMYAWGEKDNYAKIIASTDRLFEEVIGKKRVVCIADEKDELLLSHQGMMAGPIMAESGQILGMLKIETMDYTDLHVSTVQTFRILCTWIGNAYYQAQNYQKARDNSFINPVNNLYSYEFFKLQVDYTVQLARRFHFDVMRIVVRILDKTDGQGGGSSTGMESLKKIVEENLRNVDHIFNFQITGQSYYILLPGTAESYGQLVTSKINAAFENAQKDVTAPLKLSFSIETLYRKSQA